MQDQLKIREHQFKRGMKLEAVNPNSGNHIGPATVIEVIDRFYFVVEMDDLRGTEPEKRTRFCCHSGTPTIFPIQWTVYKGIKLTAPAGKVSHITVQNSATQTRSRMVQCA